MKRGGSGGGVVNVSPIITDETGIEVVFDAGSITYTGGDGGAAVSGRGGDGGSILNSSPRTNASISDFVTLNAGDGGTGASGGNGGSVREFRVTLSATSRSPAFVDIVGGHAGAGLSGPGGSGGDISGIVLPSRGVTVGVLGASSLNRALAGNGGASASGAGGPGGSINDVLSSSVEGSFVLSAGQGGIGLTQGGKGGSVIGANIQTGSSTVSKILVIAGEGGDATAFIPNAKESSASQTRAAKNAFGGRVGQGGNGGDIINFRQIGSIGAHSDLIAGNGGDTLNFGTIFDTRAFVGQGGSIRNVVVAGDIGNIAADDVNTLADENIPIKSYNNVLAGETIASFVQTNLRTISTDPTAPRPSISDSVGNVGVIIGAAGRNKAVVVDPVNAPNTLASQPAPTAKNGSLIDLTARNLLSAVAGSVDRIASIQLTQNLQILAGVIGADKGSATATGAGTVGAFDYLDAAGNPIASPVRDGRLIDGALVTQALKDSFGRDVTLPGRVFKL